MEHQSAVKAAATMMQRRVVDIAGYMTIHHTAIRVAENLPPDAVAAHIPRKAALLPEQRVTERHQAALQRKDTVPQILMMTAIMLSMMMMITTGTDTGEMMITQRAWTMRWRMRIGNGRGGHRGDFISRI